MHYEKFSDGTVECIREEIPFAIPKNWNWVRLENICYNIYAGGDKPSDFVKEKDAEHSIPVVANGTTNEGIMGFTKTSTAKANTITIAGRGTIGFPVYRNYEYCPVVRLIVINQCDLINPHFLYYYLYARRLDSVGSSIPQLTVPMVKPKLIPLPPLEEQERISLKLDLLFNIINNVNTTKDQIKIDIEKIKSKILDLAIRGKLVEQDLNEEPASVLLERIRKEKEELIKSGKLKRDKRESVIFRGDDNSYYEKLMGSSIEKQIKIPFDLPNGWVWVRGRDCFSDMTNTIPTGIDFDYIDIDSIDNREHKITKPKHLNVSDAPSRAKRAVYAGSVLFSLVRPYLQNIARVSEKHKDCIASTGFYVCNSNGVLSSEYLFYLMISPYVINGLNQFMKGDNSPSINKDDIENWLYPIPPLEEQKRITYQIEKLLTQITKIASALK